MPTPATTTTITFSPSTPPRVDQMPLAAVSSALLFTLADLAVRWRLRSPRSGVRRFFARARGEEGEKKGEEKEEKEEEERKVDDVDEGSNSKEQNQHRRRRRPAPSLDAVVEDAGIKLVGMLHVALCLPLAVFVLSEESFASNNNGNGENDFDPRLLLYASTPASRSLVSLSAGYFLWDVASILLRTWVASTERGRREGRSVGSGFLAHGLVCCSLFGLGALTGRLSYFAGVFLLWEASTPFVYARWALSAAGNKNKSKGKGKESKSKSESESSNKAAYAVCGLAMMASFFVARIVLGTRASARWWVAALAELRSPLPLPPTPPTPTPLESDSSSSSESKSLPPPLLALCLVANVAMNLLNFFWFSKMVSGAVKHFGGRSRGSSLEAATTTTTTMEKKEAAAKKNDGDDGDDRDVASFATATALAEKLQQHHHQNRVFSVRSTSASSEGDASLSTRGPRTPARTRE